MKPLREQLLEALRNGGFAPPTYYLRNCLDKRGGWTIADVRQELLRMEAEGLVRKYPPWCQGNQIHWTIHE